MISSPLQGEVLDSDGEYYSCNEGVDASDSIAQAMSDAQGKDDANNNPDYIKNIISSFQNAKSEDTPFSLFNFAADILNDITLVSIKSLRDYKALRFLSMAGDVTVLSAFVIVPLITHSYAFANALKWFSFMDPISNIALQSLNVLCGMFIYAKVLILLAKESYKMSENFIAFCKTFEFKNMSFRIKDWAEFKRLGKKLLYQTLKIILAIALTAVLFKLTTLSFGTLPIALKLVYMGAAAVMGMPNSLATIRAAGTLFCFLISYQFWDDIIKSASNKLSYMHKNLKHDPVAALLAIPLFIPKQIYREAKGLARLVYTLLKCAVTLSCLKFCVPWEGVFKEVKNKVVSADKKSPDKTKISQYSSTKFINSVSTFFDEKSKKAQEFIKSCESKVESGFSCKVKLN